MSLAASKVLESILIFFYFVLKSIMRLWIVVNVYSSLHQFCYDFINLDILVTLNALLPTCVHPSDNMLGSLKQVARGSIHGPYVWKKLGWERGQPFNFIQYLEGLISPVKRGEYT